MKHFVEGVSDTARVSDHNRVEVNLPVGLTQGLHIGIMFSAFISITLFNISIVCKGDVSEDDFLLGQSKRLSGSTVGNTGEENYIR